MLIGQLLDTGAMVVDPFTRILYKAKDGLIIKNHRKFVDADVDVACVKAAIP